MTTQSKHQLLSIRTKLSEQMLIVADLLEMLEEEAANLPAEDKRLFKQRLADIDRMMQTMVAYDSQVQLYIRTHPAAHNTKYLEDKIFRAKKYVRYLGGDWSIVEWGKNSDF